MFPSYWTWTHSIIAFDIHKLMKECNSRSRTSWIIIIFLHRYIQAASAWNYAFWMQTICRQWNIPYNRWDDRKHNVDDRKNHVPVEKTKYNQHNLEKNDDNLECTKRSWTIILRIQNPFSLLRSRCNIYTGHTRYNNCILDSRVQPFIVIKSS